MGNRTVKWFLSCLFCVCMFALSMKSRAQNLADPTNWNQPAWGGLPHIISTAGGFMLVLPQGRTWAAVTTIVSVPLNSTLILSIPVLSLSPGASWALKLDNRPYNPAHPHDVVANPPGGDQIGVYLANLAEMGGWSGIQPIEMRLFVVGKPGATVTFGHIQLQPALTYIAPGRITCRLSQSRLQFIISRPDTPGAIAIPLPGKRIRSVSRNINSIKSVTVVRTANTWCEYTTRMTAETADPVRFHWTVEARWIEQQPLEPGLPECRYIENRTVNSGISPSLFVLSAHRFGQLGYEGGEAFLPDDAAIGGTILYFENYTPLDPYFEVEHISPKAAVQANPSGFGYAMPADPKIILPAGTRLLLRDSTLLYSNRPATQPTDQADLFLRLMSDVYDSFPHPSTVLTDWTQVATDTQNDLMLPQCLANPTRIYFRNYVNEPWSENAAEIMVQLDPLVSALMYNRTWGQQILFIKPIEKTLPQFYVPEIHWLADWNRGQTPTRSDSWYLIYPLIQCLRATRLGDTGAGGLVQKVLPTVIEFAHRCGFSFPVFYNPQTLGSFEYSEPDCVGAYAYLMLQAYNRYHDPSYLNEAKTALSHVTGYGLNYSYELHLSALSAAACARMWKLTGDQKYLTMSYVPVANIIRHCWLWDDRYGLHHNNSLFFGISAMPGIYIAAFEEYQVWLALKEYLRIAGRHLPYPVLDLVSEFVKYAPTVLRYTLPPLMTPGSVAIRNGRGHPNDPSLYIPVEDVNDGWTPSGTVGQEIYGSGAPMALAAGDYHLITDAGIMIYSEYPLTHLFWNRHRRSLQFHLIGVPSHHGRVEIKYSPSLAGWSSSADLRIQPSSGADVIERQNRLDELIFLASGGSILTIQAAMTNDI
ncbi:MAG: hypothetical protein M1330_00190, partial [Armatimonadetes bacterium]|nr:hypothetical protein [Armatimonadota bacterium]